MVKYLYLILEMLIDDDGGRNNNGTTNTVNTAENIALFENRRQILDNIEEVTITYISYDETHNNFWIMGDFTDWEPKPMSRGLDGLYFYTVVLLKGFKYYFQFTERNEFLIDFNRDYEINQKSGQVNNFLDLKKSTENSEIASESPSTPFDYKLHSNLLLESRKNYSKLLMGDQEEVRLLEEVIEFSTKYKDRYNNLLSKKEEDKNRVKKFFE
jgi:hypothetical protein